MMKIILLFTLLLLCTIVGAKIDGACIGEIDKFDEECFALTHKDDCEEHGVNAFSDGKCDWMSGLEEETGAIYQPQSLSVALVDAKASELVEDDAEVEENVGEVIVASVGYDEFWKKKDGWVNCGNKKFPDGGKAFHCKTKNNNFPKEKCQYYAHTNPGVIGMQWARIYGGWHLGWQGHCIIYFEQGITYCPSLNLYWYQNSGRNQDFNRDGKCGAYGGSTWFYEYKKKACRDDRGNCDWHLKQGHCKGYHYQVFGRKYCYKTCSGCQSEEVLEQEDVPASRTPDTGEEISIGAPFEGLEEETGAIYQPPADAELELGNESPEFEEVEIGHEEPEVEHGHSTGEEVSIGAPFEESNGHGYNFWNFYTGFALSVAATLLVIKFRGSKEDPASYALLHEEI